MSEPGGIIQWKQKRRIFAGKAVWNRFFRQIKIMSINVVEKTDDSVKVKCVLVSVSDKTGLDTLIPGLLALNPDIQIFSTGGTFDKIIQILGDRWRSCLTQVSDYTGQPETQGGLVKTLDFKIYLGLLTETYNDSHKADLERTGALALDMVVANLYPFKETISKAGVSVEQARGNIDIGGPCMIRAAAKNYLRVASLVDPSDYSSVLADIKAGNGSTSFALRYRLARKAFDYTAGYDRTIADFFTSRSVEEAATCYAGCLSRNE
jgi:phosphoribosylaminoimidazolecarboxamide formyltransferase / IMP cyclohydrolase